MRVSFVMIIPLDSLPGQLIFLLLICVHVCTSNQPTNTNHHHHIVQATKYSQKHGVSVSVYMYLCSFQCWKTCNVVNSKHNILKEKVCEVNVCLLINSLNIILILFLFCCLISLVIELRHNMICSECSAKTICITKWLVCENLHRL